MKRDTHAVVDAAVSHGGSELARVDYIDGWRGVAIALVLFAHFGPRMRFDSGRFGVDVFFCLSGFLMSNILFAKRVPLAVFYKRRISRIIPVFLLFVVLVFSVSSVVTRSASTSEFLYTLTFLRTYLPGTSNIWRSDLPIGHLWSLNAEEHCYVFLSCVTLLSFVRGREWLALIGAGWFSIVLSIAYARFPWAAPSGGVLGTEAVAAPLLLSAGYFLAREAVLPYVRSWMPLAALLTAAITYLTQVPWWIRPIAAPVLLAFAVNHLSETPAQFRKFLALPGMRLLGLWSYSIYLWQQPFYVYRHHLIPGAGFLLAVAVGACSFYFFENPLRTAINRRW